MEHHIVIGAVVGMTVQVPVGRLDMHLQVARPEGVAYTHTRVKKIGTGIMVQYPGALHNHRKPVGSDELALQQLVLPYVLQKRLCHAQYVN